LFAVGRAARHLRGCSRSMPRRVRDAIRASADRAAHCGG
jgi:hypothetical protein